MRIALPKDPGEPPALTPAAARIVYGLRNTLDNDKKAMARVIIASDGTHADMSLAYAHKHWELAKQNRKIVATQNIMHAWSVLDPKHEKVFRDIMVEAMRRRLITAEDVAVMDEPNPEDVPITFIVAETAA